MISASSSSLKFKTPRDLGFQESSQPLSGPLGKERPHALLAGLEGGPRQCCDSSEGRPLVVGSTSGVQGLLTSSADPTLYPFVPSKSNPAELC